MVEFGAALPNLTASQINDRFFGTVVKSGEAFERVNNSPTGEILTGASTNYGRTLNGVTETTIALDFLGVGSIRYPGGTESRLFNINDPEDLAGLHRVLEYCAAQNLALNFTLDDAPFLDPVTQTAGFRGQEQALTQFIQKDLIGAAAALGVTIESIHIGNEFQGRTVDYGSPAYLGYAKVSAFLVNALDAILGDISSAIPRPQIVIQPPNWIANGQQAAFFDVLKSTFGADGASAASKIDAIDLHGLGSQTLTATNTLNITWDSYFGIGIKGNYQANLAAIMRYWQNDPALSHVQFRNDAWAYNGTPNLSDAALGMLQIHTASLLGFVSVTNYIGYNIDSTALISARNGDDLIRAGGALFAMMSDALHGTAAVSLSNAPNLTTEAEAAILQRAFAGGDRAVLYIVNRTNSAQPTDVNALPLIASLETFIGGVARSEALILGTIAGVNSAATLDEIFLTSAALGAIGTDITLNAYETAQITLTANGRFGSDLGDILTGTARGDVLHGLLGDDTLYGAGGNDKLAGGAGDDRLFGGAGNDALYGGSGADILNGGVGVDTASYLYADGGVRVNLADARQNMGAAAGDQFFLIERIQGSQFDDILIGSISANSLWGEDGDDVIQGGFGKDTLYGGNGDDTLNGGAAGDLLLGGAGQDMADYAAATSAVTANLFSPNRNMGEAKGDIFRSIEDLRGSRFNDQLIGNGQENAIFGGAGRDRILGYGGDDLLQGDNGRDTLSGGAGNDTLIGGMGADLLAGGSGHDTFLFYRPTEGGDTISDFGATIANNDVLWFYAANFGNLGLGQLQDSQLRINSSTNQSLDFDDYFVFRQSDKSLWFNPDPRGGETGTLIVYLQDSAVTADDIWMF